MKIVKQRPSGEVRWAFAQLYLAWYSIPRRLTVTDTDDTLTLTGDAARLDRERAAHQITMLELEAARDRIADLERRLGDMTATAAQANRDAAAALERERLASALDRTARAITGQSAAVLNAALGIEVRGYPQDFDPTGGHP